MTALTGETNAPQPEGDPVLPIPGRPPTATPSAAAVGVLLALVMLAIGGVALRDSATTWGWLRSARWIDAAFSHLDGLHFSWWMLALGAAATAVGLWMIVVAVRPRRTTAIALVAPTSTWMPLRDVARLAAYTASTVAGVTSAHATATRRKVTVTAELVDSTTAGLTTRAIAAAVDDANTLFVSPPRLKVRIKESASR